MYAHGSHTYQRVSPTAIATASCAATMSTIQMALDGIGPASVRNSGCAASMARPRPRCGSAYETRMKSSADTDPTVLAPPRPAQAKASSTFEPDDQPDPTDLRIVERPEIRR